jgi:hypothetical protein
VKIAVRPTTGTIRVVTVNKMILKIVIVIVMLGSTSKERPKLEIQRSRNPGTSTSCNLLSVLQPSHNDHIYKRVGESQVNGIKTDYEGSVEAEELETDHFKLGYGFQLVVRISKSENRRKS